ncbi:MAG: signal peptide peptidase SppA [Leptolyngbyaceae cyanobacterium SM2_5_2]|nr:signal peptide peptidase SppA [Leptolyngbyaceae cyanobacterium SM2_5_2]
MRQFLKYTLASLTGSILFFLLLGFLVAVGAVGLAGVLVANLAKGGAPAVEKDSVLVYDLSTLIVDSPVAVDPGSVVLGTAPPSQLALRQAVLAVEEAATDPRIVALYLKGSGSLIGAGLANQMDLRQAIARFKETDKPVIAYDLSWSEREYYLASLADTVYLNPFGEVEMNGLYAETLYQAEALQKLGIGVQVVRVGAYKSAFESLTRNTMSLQERQQTQRLLQDVWQALLADTAQARSLQPQQLQAIANTQGFVFGDAAKTQKLVDQIAYEDEVITALREITGEGAEEQPGDQDNQYSFRQVSLSRYAQVVDDELTSRSASQQIALVYAEGPIIDGESSGGFGQTSVIAGNTVAHQLRQVRQDDEVKAVVLRVNSPGGSATAAEVILREVQLIQAAGKPVVVSMGDVAASGGYWISATADAIVAQPATITGSIGVVSLFLNLQNLGDNVGVAWDGVKTAELADIFSSSRPKTAQELAIFQKAVDSIYNAFLDRVETGRNLPRNQVANLAQGRVWSGKSSQELGLVDELGGLEQAITKAATLANLGDDWRLQEYPEPTEWQRFFSLFQAHTVSLAGPADALTEQMTRVFNDNLDLVKTLNDPRGLYMRLPATLVIE